MTIFIRVYIISLLIMNFLVSDATGGNESPGTQSSNFPLSSEDLTFDDINRLVDQVLKTRKENHVDPDKLTNDLLNIIYKKREQDKRQASIVLLRMYQYSDAEDSEFITQMYIDYLIHSACGMPQVITEDPNHSDANLKKDARRILSDIKGMDVDQTLRNKIISIVQKWNEDI